MKLIPIYTRTLKSFSISRDYFFLSKVLVNQQYIFFLTRKLV